MTPARAAVQAFPVARYGTSRTAQTSKHAGRDALTASFNLPSLSRRRPTPDGVFVSEGRGFRDFAGARSPICSTLTPIPQS
jgi:hypothetical protein